MTEMKQLDGAKKTWAIALILFIVTMALFWPSVHYDFVAGDDAAYVYENPQVQRGLSLDGLRWAFTTIDAANWHPLTWVSLMADSSMFGGFAGGYHLINFFLHAINTLLLFLLLKRMTSAFWPSAFAAAFFGWHPLHVESVAWVAERKDVLSTLFLILTLWAYLEYTEKGKTWRYLVALAMFALGLMAKPMLVTVPLVLLLLDYWPLKRERSMAARPQATNTQWPSAKLLLEKLPFFGLALGTSVMTWHAQNAGKAIKSFQVVPLSLRTSNAILSYAMYLRDILLPRHLSPSYPLPSEIPVSYLALAIGLLAAISWLALHFRSMYPWVLIGWLWFLISLLPVIGLIQIGSQARADRYMYIPSIGLFVAGCWSIAEALKSKPQMRNLSVSLGAGALIAIMLLTHRQLAYWHDSITLFTRALTVTRDNATAENNLAVGLSKAGHNLEAIPHYERAVRLAPNFAKYRYNLGIELAAQNKLPEAEYQFSEALKLNPQSEKAHNNLGVVLAQENKSDAAMEQFRESIRLNPLFPSPYLNLAMELQDKGDFGAAFTNYTKAVELQPDGSLALDKFALFLAKCPGDQWRNPVHAVRLATQANDITGYRVSNYVYTLAECYRSAGQASNAAVLFEQLQRGQSPANPASLQQH